MKKLLTTVALVVVVATPVLAQTQDRTQQRTRVEAQQARTTQAQQQRRSANNANDVYDIRGHRVGADPDPTIRAQIANDPTQAGD
jgi:Ni/Co efflux regulator RcnB